MSRKEKYTYPAIFDYADDGITITFPDLPGCISCGFSDEEALHMAKDAMSGYIYTSENDNVKLAEPTPLKLIKIKNNQRIQLIEIYMPA